MGIGDTLAEARRQAGLTITQVSQRTRIRESIIRAIEQGDYTACGGDFYARGHIRSIADVVGVDPVPLIREYDEEHGQPGSMRASQIFQPTTPIKIREPRHLHLGRVLAVAVLALLGFGAYRLYTNVSNNNNNPTAAVSPPSASPSPVATPSHTNVNATAHKAGPRWAVIRLTATQDCWVGLTNGAGHQVYQGIISAGKTMSWTEKQSIFMTIGNPPGIRLTVNGKKEPMHTVQVVHVTINPQSKTNLVAMG